MTLFLRRMIRRPFRAAVTISLVGVGLATYLLIRTVALALLERYQTVVAASEAEVVVQQAGIGLALLSRISRDDVRRIAEVGGVRSAVGVILQLTRLPDGTRLFVAGLEPGAPVIRVLHVTAGRTPTVGASEVLLGSGAAARLRLAPGDDLELLGHRLRIAGVFSSGIGFLDQWVVVDTATAQALFQLGDIVNLVLVDIDPGARTEGVIAETRRRLPHLQATVSDLYLATFQERATLERFALLLALVGLAAGALAASLAAGAAVHERTGELAILRAMGWGRRRIVATVLGETVVVTALGTAVGLAATLVVMRSAGTGPLAGFVPALPLPGVVAEGCVTMLLASLAGSLPALARALRIQPARVLNGG